MSEKKKKVPRLRFPGFSGEWEERKLGDYTKLITKGTTPKDKTGNGSINFIKIENISYGRISPVTKISEEEHDNYLKRSKLQENDILFSIAGTLGRVAVVDITVLPANTNQALSIIRGHDFDTNFLVISLSGKVATEFIRKNPTVGAQPNLSLEQVGKLDVWTPRIEEQAKIGSFFNQIDHLITLHQGKLTHLQIRKKRLLQKMFPKNGEQFPELRFPGFTDAWEVRELGTIFNKIRNAFVGTATPYYVDKGHFYLESNNIKDGQINRNSEIFINDEFYEKQKYNWLHTGDIVMVQSGHVGHSAVIPPELNNTAAHALIIFAEPMERINAYFMNYQFQTTQFKQDMGSITTGNTIKHILSSEMKKFKVLSPKYNEQAHIGVFFQRLDALITLHQRKLNHLQDRKKALLQQMFI